MTFRPGYQYIVGYSLQALDDEKNTFPYNASVYISDISNPDNNEEAVTTIQVTKIHTYGQGINLKFKCLPGFDPSLFSCWVGVWNSEVNFRTHPCIAGMRIPGYESRGQLSLNVTLEAETEYRAVLFMDGWNDSLTKCSSQNAAAYDVFSTVNMSKEG